LPTEIIRELECLKPVKMSGQTDLFQISQGSSRRDRERFSRYIIGKAILKETGNEAFALLNRRYTG